MEINNFNSKTIYKLLNVTRVQIYKEGSIYILRTLNNVFKTQYINHIPIKSITDEEFQSIKVFTYK